MIFRNIESFLIFFFHLTYFFFFLLFLQGPDDIFVVFGVNHQTTGKSTYASITAYQYSTLSGLVSVSSENGYQNSADKYLPGGKKHRSSSYLFAHSFARECHGGDEGGCYEVPFEGVGSVPLNEFIFWIERAYVNPITLTGPAANETIMARALHF